MAGTFVFKSWWIDVIVIPIISALLSEPPKAKPFSSNALTSASNPYVRAVAISRSKFAKFNSIVWD